ncbi:MAG: TIGR03086 family metal-binding protein [Acidimicrobiales bacterium]
MTDTTDYRLELFLAYDQAWALAESVNASELHDPTPCPAMDVSALLDHLVFAARRAAGLGRGQAPSSDFSAPHVELGDVAPAIRVAASESKEAWGDDASLTRTITMPGGETYPGSALAGVYLVEIATHAWDLAFATNTINLLDQELGEDALACAKATIRDDYRNAEGNPFGPVVEPPAEATSWERLAAFMGRSPRR